MQYPTMFATVATTADAWRTAEPRHVPSGKENVVKTVRLDHLRAALLAAVAGLLAAVGSLMVLYAQSAEANYPGNPGKIAYSGWDGNDLEIYTINAGGGGKSQVTDSKYYSSQPSWGIRP